MSSPEALAYSGYICRTIDRIVDCLDGLGSAELNWRPPAENSNSLYTIAEHAIANAEENVLGVVCGLPIERAQASEFTEAMGSSESLRGRSRKVLAQIETEVAKMTRSDLELVREHPRRGNLPAYEVLIVARHAAEHQGQAELTRDLLRARLNSAEELPAP